MSPRGQNPVPMAFPSRQEECCVATHFSSLYASLSVCTSVKCVVRLGFFFFFFLLKAKAFPKPQTKPQQVDG